MKIDTSNSVNNHARESICHSLTRKIAWIGPKSRGDLAILGLTAACFAGGGLLGGGFALAGYLMNRWDSADPIHEIETIREIKTDALPLPQLRSPTDAERKSQNKNDPVNFVTVPLKNQGNTCCPAVLAQMYLFPHEEAIRAKAKELESQKKWYQKSPLELQGIQKIIQFIDSYRKEAETSLKNKKAANSVDIIQLIDSLKMINPNYKRACENAFYNSIHGEFGYIAWYNDALEKFQNDVRILSEQKKEPLSAEEKKKCESELEKTKHKVQHCQAVISFLKKAPMNRSKLSEGLQKFGLETLAKSIPYTSQQDLDEMIGFLYEFIDVDPSLRLSSFATLQLDEGIKINGHSSDDPKKYRLPEAKYSGRMFIPLVETEKFKEDTEGKRHRVYEHDSSVHFKQLFQEAFIGTSEPIRLSVKTEEKEQVKDVNIESRREQLSTAPKQLVLSFKRFLIKDDVSYPIRGQVPGIDEIMEVPGDYFKDGRRAVYRLQSIGIHTGGNSADDGHYWSIVRKFDAKTLESRFDIANDGAVKALEAKEPCKTVNEQFLAHAGEAYVLIYEKI